MCKNLRLLVALSLLLFAGLSLSAQTGEDECMDAAGSPVVDADPSILVNNTAGTMDEDFSGDTGCGSEVYESSVWFEFEPTSSGTVVITLDGEAGTVFGGDVSIVIVDPDVDCATALDGFCGDWGTEIDGTDINLYCNAIAGETYAIQISSELAEAGTFEIAIETMSNDANDLCDDAELVTAVLTCSNSASVPPVVIDLACPDSEAGCVSSSDPGVWFELQIDPLVPFFDISGNDFELFEGPDCGSLTSLGCSPLTGLVHDPALTYYVLAMNGASWTAEPTYAEQTSSGDQCADAMVVGIGTFSSFTICQTNDHDECGGGSGDTDEQTIWFEYTATNNEDITISVSQGANNPIGDLSIAVFDACGGAIYDDGDADLDDALDCSAGFDTDHILNCVPAGTSLFIAIGSSNTGEGEFDLNISAVDVSASNDDCADAIDLSAGSNTGLTNECASYDIDVASCGTPDSESSVWYAYNISSPITSITFDLSAGDITNPVWAVYSGACGGLVLEGEECSGGQIEIECPPVGDLFIQVASVLADAGTFDISVTEGSASAANDLCDDATDAGTLPDDCTPTTISGTTVNSCPEAFSLAGCDIDTEPTVWHQFTAPAGTVELEFMMLTGGAEFTLWDGCPTGGTAFGPTCFSAGITTFTVGAGTYWISASHDIGAEGPFSFDVLAIVPPSNDECADAIGLGSGNNAGLTNLCATDDVNVGGCSAASSEATVWYSYNIANPIAEITIDLSGSGTAITNPAFAVYDGCGGAVLDEDCSGTTVTITCPPVGDIFIQVGSESINAGEFNIEITEGNATPTNDICDNATDEGTLPDCIPQNIAGDNTGSCPENFTLAGCNIDTEATVWHEITVPGGAVQLVIENVNGTVDITIWDGCPTGGTAQGPVCVSGDATINIGGGGTYFISISSPAGSEGAYDFDITAIVPPTNDLCADADPASAGVTNGTNVCSTIDVILPCQPGSVDAVTVWYEYVVPAGVKSVTISIAGSGGNPIMGDIFMGAFTDCGGTLFDGNSFTCTGDDITLACPDAGSSIFISIGSEAANAGDFDITIVEENPVCTYNNDECADAEPFPNDPETNMGEECISGCNELACPDDQMDGACGATANVVWFTFTTDNFDPATETFLLANVDNAVDFDPVLQLFDGCGGAAIGPCAGNLNLSSDDWPITPNTTYWIAVGNADDTQTGGTFDLCVELVQGCSNDECPDAITLPDGTTVNTQTTNCTEDINSFCGTQGSNDASAWYSYEVPAGVTAFEVNVSGGPSDLSIQWALEIDCGNAEADLTAWMDPECDANAGPFVQPCVQEGEVYTFYIASSAPGDAFDITVEGLAPGDPANPSPENDLCDGAEEFTITDDCEPSCVVVNNIDACPEDFAVGGGCDIDMDPTVWFMATLPASAVAMEITGLTNGVHVSIFEGPCTGLAFVDCATGDLFVNATPGTTYWFAVGAAQETDTHEFCVTAVVPPPNDTACDIGDFAPFVIPTGGGQVSGTTCCAIGWNDGMQDFQNQECGGASDDNAVWFLYQFSGNSDAIEIGASTPGSGNWSLEVYLVATEDEACDGTLTYSDVWSDCAASESIQIGCPDPDQFYLIKLTSDDENCGDYTVGVNEIPATCDYADECDEITGAQTLVTAPTDPNCGAFINTSLESCLEFACPETIIGACGASDFPTVWMAIEVDDIAVQLVTSIEPCGSWEPSWALYFGDDCGNLTQAFAQDADGNNIPCGMGANTYQIGVDDAANGMYFVAITGLGDIDDPCFTLNAFTTDNCIVCLGEEGGCESLTTFEVTDRSNDFLPIDSDGDGIAGPFCPGEEITVCLNFFYDASDTGVDWLIGFVPTFGPGWDLEESNIPSQSLGGMWEWYEEGGSCAPIIQEQMPNLCTYTDANGNLQVCNVLCEPCPCSPPMLPLTALPSGWFWVTNGGLAGCANDCSPGEGYGIGTTTITIDVCFTLVVKEFDTMQECLDNQDLRISFQTFSDGVAGCWEDPVGECKLDNKQQGPEWQVDCNVSPPVVHEPMLICSGEEANADLIIEGGLDGTIFVEPDPDKVTGVTGLGEHEFSGGAGTINDILENCGTDIDSAHYLAFAVVDGFNCPGPPTPIAIPVVPKIEPTPEDFVGCLPFTLELDATDQYTGGAPDFEYQWFENGTTLLGTGVTLTHVLTPTTDFIELHVTYGLPDVMCFEIITIEITVFEALTPTAVNDDPFDCNGEGCVSYTTPPGQIINDDEWVITDWKGDEYDTGGGSVYCFDAGTPPGIYTVELFVENDGGCIGGDTLNYVEFAIPDFTITEEMTGDCDEIILCVDFYCGEDPEDDFCLQGADCNEDGIPDIYDALDASGNVIVDADGEFVLDGVPGFISVEWNGFNIVPPGGFDENFELDQLCFTVSASGNYELEIEGPGGCTGFNNIEVTIGNEALLDEVPDQFVCEGDDLIIEATPNDPALTYTWYLATDLNTPIATTNPATITPTVSGTYVVEVTDPNGCPASDAFEVTIFTLPVFDMPDGSLCVGSQIDFCAPGDPATWTYVWESGGSVINNTQCFTVTGTPSDQMFTVTWTDENGCSFTDDFTVASEALIDLGNTDGFACSDAAVSVPYDVGGAFMGYEWTFGGNTVSNMSTVIALDYGVYTVTFTDGNCPGEATFTVIQVDPPAPFNFPDAAACNVDNGGPIGTCVDLLAVANTGGTWTLDPAFDPANTDLSNVCFDNLAPGPYVFTFTTNTAIPPCMDSPYTFTVNVSNCSCDANVMDPAAVCEGPGSIDLNTLYFTTTDPGVWTSNTPPATIAGSVLDYTNLPPGIYELEHTSNPTGMMPCSDVINFEITALPILELGTPISPCSSSADGPSQVDINDVITSGAATVDPASLPAGATYDAASNTIDFNGVPMGSYTITLITTDAVMPCENITQPLTIDVQDCDCPEPVFQDPPTLCNAGGQYDLDDLFDGTVFLGTWTVLTEPAGSNLVIGADNVIDQTDLLLGDYTLQFVINNPEPGCPSIYEVGPLVIITQPVAGQDGEDLVCLNEDQVFDLFTYLTGADVGGNWVEISAVPSTGAAFDPVNGTFTSNGQASGTYTFQYEIVVAAPCNSVSSLVEIEIEGLPNVDAGTATLITCDNPSVTIGNAAGTASGVGIEYVWTELGDPTVVIGTDPEISVTQPGQYTLEVTDQTTGCTSFGMISVLADTDIPTFELEFSDSPCFGANEGMISYVNVQGGGGNYQYSFDGGTSFGPESEFTNLEPGTYDLILLDGNGCEIPSSITIDEPPLVTIDAGPDLGIVQNTPNILNFISSVPVEDIANVVWTDDQGNVICDGPYGECGEISVEADVSTTYTVSITTIADCRATDDVRLNLTIVKDCYVPNIINLESPDVVNPWFFMYCDEFAEKINHFYVFDRWGELVFSAEDIQPNIPDAGWDGKLNGKDVVPGVYVYLIEVKFIEDDDPEVYTGDITVIR